MNGRTDKTIRRYCTLMKMSPKSGKRAWHKTPWRKRASVRAEITEAILDVSPEAD